ncbi:hypothetical protein MMC25_002507 [Agyrium rufum]|nr:hypothetical protein [Agyrium rufum]
MLVTASPRFWQCYTMAKQTILTSIHRRIAFSELGEARYEDALAVQAAKHFRESGATKDTSAVEAFLSNLRSGKPFPMTRQFTAADFKEMVSVHRIAEYFAERIGIDGSYFKGHNNDWTEIFVSHLIRRLYLLQFYAHVFPGHVDDRGLPLTSHEDQWRLFFVKFQCREIRELGHIENFLRERLQPILDPCPEHWGGDRRTIDVCNRGWQRSPTHRELAVTYARSQYQLSLGLEHIFALRTSNREKGEADARSNDQDGTFLCDAPATDKVYPFKMEEGSGDLLWF